MKLKFKSVTIATLIMVMSFGVMSNNAWAAEVIQEGTVSEEEQKEISAKFQEEEIVPSGEAEEKVLETIESKNKKETEYEVALNSTSETSAHMWYQFNGNIDIRGYRDGNLVQTTYSNAGYTTALSCDGENSELCFNENGDTAKHSSGLTVTPNVSFSKDGSYVIVKYVVKNPTSNRKTYSLAVCADVDIESDDYASVYKTNNGFKMMNTSNSTTYYLICRNISGMSNSNTRWIGYYSERMENAYVDSSNDEYIGSDSGLALSWKDKTIGPNNTATFMFQVGIGDTGEIEDYYETGKGFVIGEDNNSFNHNWMDFFNGTKLSKQEIYDNFPLDPLHVLANLWISTNPKKIVDCGKDIYYVVDTSSEPKLFTYAISDNYDRLFSNADKKTKSDIQKNMNKKWDGACHGIAISMAIASQDVNLSQAGITNNYHNAGKPKDNKKLRDTIHYYSLSQYTSKGKDTKKYNKPGYFGSLFGEKDELHSFLSALVEEGRKSQKEQKPFVFSFRTKDEGHSIVAYNLKELGNDMYEISLYDENCNYSSKISIDLAQDTFSFKEGNGDANNDHSSHDKNDCTSLSYISIDDLFGTISTLSVEDDLSGCQIISISANKKCKIENNAGEYIFYDGNQYNGTMKVYDIDVLGENANAEIRFYVDPYESLSMTDFDEEIELTATIGEKYYSIKNEGGNTVTVGSDQIDITGSKYIFDIYVSDAVSNTDMMSVSAEATGNVTVATQDGVLLVEPEKLINNTIITSFEDNDTNEEAISGNVTNIEITNDGDNDIAIDSVVSAKSLLDKDIVIKDIENQVYTGKKIEPEININNNTTQLNKGTDYEVNYSNNINAGTAIVKIVGKGNYTGERNITFKIDPTNISDINVISKNQTYNGKAKTPAITVKHGNNVLNKGTDYTLSYTNNVNAGKAKIIVTGKGNYTGTKITTFKIKKASQTLKLNVKKKNYKAETLKNKKVKFTIKVSKRKTPITFKVIKGSKKCISVSKKGVVTMKKAKKGIYKVKVTAKSTKNHYKAEKIVTIKVK